MNYAYNTKRLSLSRDDRKGNMAYKIEENPLNQVGRVE
jgi:hypothetical protein